MSWRHKQNIFRRLSKSRYNTHRGAAPPENRGKFSERKRKRRCRRRCLSLGRTWLVGLAVELARTLAQDFTPIISACVIFFTAVSIFSRQPGQQPSGSGKDAGFGARVGQKMIIRNKHVRGLRLTSLVLPIKTWRLVGVSPHPPSPPVRRRDGRLKLDARKGKTHHPQTFDNREPSVILELKTREGYVSARSINTTTTKHQMISSPFGRNPVDSGAGLLVPGVPEF